MIPSEYLGYFQAAAQAAAALLGLLFVVIALRPGQIVGARANSVAKGLAASTFTGLVDAFFVSLLALIPATSSVSARPSWRFSACSTPCGCIWACTAAGTS